MFIAEFQNRCGWYGWMKRQTRNSVHCATSLRGDGLTS